MVFECVYNITRQRFQKRTNEILIMGIGEYTDSGKNSFAREFSQFLNERGISNFSTISNIFNLINLICELGVGH